MLRQHLLFLSLLTTGLLSGLLGSLLEPVLAQSSAPAEPVPPPPPAPPLFSNPPANLPIPNSSSPTSIANPPNPGEIRASLPSKSCSSRLLNPLQPSQAVAVGRESFAATFYLEGTATQPGFLTCGLQEAEFGKAQQVKVQFGLVDELPPNSRATVAAYLDGKLFRSVTLNPKQRITTWDIPAQDKKSLTLEVGCPGNCKARVYFTQADMVAPAPIPVAVTPIEPPPTEPGAQPRDPETGRRRAENTLRMLWLLRGLFGFF